MASSLKVKSFTFYTIVSWRRKLVAWSMLFFYLTQPILASAEVIADSKAPGNNTPIVQSAANGVPVVQIAAPSVGGVSHNLYQKFNVDPSGLILNNSYNYSQTQLAGYITGNSNLVNGPARIILNEVTSSNPSYLRGYTEVAGQKAEVIIANPNGIYGNGFGFINTSRAILTTGTPVFGGSGSLDAFRVSGGQITIEGNGLDGKSTDQVDLISRTAQINAGIWAKNLNVITGANDVNHSTLETVKQADSEPIPQVALDVGQLGGMYANKIYLVGTDKGVGVNSQGSIVADNDIILNQEGQILLSGATSAGRNIEISTRDSLLNTGNIYAQGNLNLLSNNQIENSGIIAAGNNTTVFAQDLTSTGTLASGINKEGAVGSSGDLKITADGLIAATGQNITAGDLHLTGTSIDLAGSHTYAGHAANVTATAGGVDNTGGLLEAKETLVVTASGTVRNDQAADNAIGTMTADQIVITAQDISNQGGSIVQYGTGHSTFTAVDRLDNTKGSIVGNGTVQFQTGTLENTQGTITAQQQIHINSGTIVNNQGILAGKGLISITAQDEVANQQGIIEAGSGVNLTAQSFDNQEGKVIGLDSRDIILNSQIIQNQSGLIGSNGDVQIRTNSLVNNGGEVISKGDLTLTSTQGMDNSQGTLVAGQNLTLKQDAGTFNNNQGTVQAGNDVLIDADTITNNGGNLIAQRDVRAMGKTLDGNGKILAGRDINLALEDFNNGAGGQVQAERDLTLQANGVIANQGSVTALQDVLLDGGIISNSSGASLKAGTSLHITADKDINNQGTIYAKEDVDIQSGDTLTNEGVIAAAQNNTLAAYSIASTGTLAAGIQDDGTLGSDGNLTITAESSLTAQGKNLAGKDINITGADINIAGATTYAGISANLTANNGNVNNTGGQIQANDIVTIKAQGKVINDKNTAGVAGEIKANTVAVTAKDISNKGGNFLQYGQEVTKLIAANGIDNTGGKIATNGMDLVMDAGNLINNQGQIQHAGAGILTIATDGELKNINGSVIGNGIIELETQNADNNQGTISAKKQLTVKANTLDNSEGIIVSADTVQVTVDEGFTNEAGQVEAAKSLTLTSQSLNNQEGRIASLDQSGLTLAVSQKLQNQLGIIGGNGQVNISTDSVDNKNGQILSKENLTVTTAQGMDNSQGIISAGNDLLIKQNTANFKNQQGTVEAGRDLEMQVGAIANNAGSIAANRDISFAVQQINGAGTVRAGQDIRLTGNDSFTNGVGNELKANRDIDVSVSGKVTNQGSMQTVRNLTLSGSDISNGPEAFLVGNENATVNAVGTVSNSGSIFANNLTIIADKVVNAEDTAAIAATQDVNLYAITSLENKDGATIYSTGNINIAGTNEKDKNGQYRTRTKNLLNQSANIEADKDISIYADEIVNKKREYVVGKTVISSVDYKDKFGFTNHNGVIQFRTFLQYVANLGVVGNGYNGVFLIGEDINKTDILKDSPEGKIIAGRNMLFHSDSTTNDMSWMLAGGNMTGSGEVQNIATGGYQSHTRHLAEFINGGQRPDLGGILFWGDVVRFYDETVSEQTPGSTSLFGGGQQVNIVGTNLSNVTLIPGSVVNTSNNINTNASGVNAGKVEKGSTTANSAILNIAIDSENISIGDIQTLLPSAQSDAVPVPQTTNGDTITLPKNGLYEVHPDPTALYLVETNPKFTSFSKFISSDYMLKQLNIDPAVTQKRLGDGFYEQKIVREQITELTGRVYLPSYDNAEEQYKALLQNGVTYAEQFQLKVGVALTAEQMKSLTSDLVWMVEKEVEGQKVLVPIVYLADGNDISLTADGAIITADHVNIQISNTANNAGTIKAIESTRIGATNINNIGGTIDGDLLKISAEQDILNISGSLSGKYIELDAGRDFTSETFTTTTKFPSLSKTTAGNIASVDAGQNLIIDAGRDLTLTSSQLNAGNDISLTAERDLNIGTITEEEKWNLKSNQSVYVTNIQTSIMAGNNITLNAQENMTLQGIQVSSGNDVTLKAGGNIDIGAVQDLKNAERNGYIDFNNQHKVDNKVSDLKAVGNVQITSGSDMNLSGVQVTAGDNIQTTAGRDIYMTAVKDRADSDIKSGFGNDNYTRIMTSNETVIGTNFKANGDISIGAEGSLHLEGSSVVSDNGNIKIDVDQGITVKEVTEEHEALMESKKTKSGFLSKKTTVKRDYSVINEVVGSTISGEAVNITAGTDLILQASNVIGNEDVSLSAKEDVNILSAAETGVSEHYSYTKKSGLFSGGGLGFTIGSQSTKTTTNEQTLGEVGSTIGSIKGDVSLIAGDKVISEGTEFISGNDLNITGKDVTIDNTINTYDSQTKFEFKQTGLTVSLGGGIVDVATSAYKNIKRSGQVEDDRLKTLYQYKAYNDLKKLNKAYDNAVNLVDQKVAKDVDDVLKNDLSINVSFGTTKTTSTSTVHTETVNTSNIDAGGDVTITATAGDVNLKGTKINAEDITLDAKDNINIQSAEDKLQTTNNTSTSSASIGASFGLTTGAFGGLSGNFNSSKGHENENSTANVESIIDASGTLTMNSGEDTNILGSKVKGETVVANIKGDLNIASRQDTDDYTSKNHNSSLGFTTGNSKGITGSTSKGKTDSTYASVTDQAGIYAGEGGFDINVGKNTDLKGAVIASEATPDKNKLSTDTLTYSDIQNNAKYDSNSKGIGIDTKNRIPVTPKISMPISGKAESVTNSAIAEAAIEVRSGNVDMNQLSRNTNESLHTLGKIFDKKTVEEKRELADQFGEMAFKAIGDLAEKQKERIAKESANQIQALLDKAEEAKKSGQEEEVRNYQKQVLNIIDQLPKEIAKWSDGGSMKTALHAIAGGLMAELGGGNIASGALSAWTNETLLNVIKPKTKEEAEWASVVIGAATGAITGDTNSVLSGVSIAISATKNNIGLHYTEQQKAIKNAQVEKLIAEGMNPIEAMKTVDQNWKDIGIVQGKIYDSAMVQGVTMLVLKGSSGWVIDEDQAILRIQQQYSNLREEYPQLTDEQFNQVYAYGVEQGAAVLKIGAEVVALEVGVRLAFKIGGKVVEFVRGTKTVDDFVLEEVVVTGEKTIKESSNARLTVPSLAKGGDLAAEELTTLTSKEISKGIQAEIDTAKLFKQEGYDLKVLKEVEGGNGYGIKSTSNPDFLIEGKTFDCYAPQGSSFKTVIKEISGKTKEQAERITLNLDNYKGDIGELKDQILKKTNGDLRRLEELLVVKDGKITRWFTRGE